MKKLLIFFIILMLILTIFNTGCTEKKPDKPTFSNGEIYYANITIDDLEIDINNLPEMGSSTSAHPLATLIGCKILNISYIWTNDIRYPIQYGKGIILPNISYLNTYQYPYFGYYNTENYIVPNATDPNVSYISENITKKIDRSGTHGSYVGLIEGNYSLIIAARLPSEDELELANNYSVELVAKPLALDAFVFILNRDNPLDNLTVDEIKNIYTGNFTDWINISNISQFQNNYSVINAYTRNDNSGSQELMKTLVMKNLDMINEQNMVFYMMSGPYNQLAWDPYGIAYSVYFYKKFMANSYVNVKLCGVNGLYPCYDSIYNQTYPYTTKVYVVINKNLDVNNPAYKIRDWLLTNEGQSVIKESGYVPISG